MAGNKAGLPLPWAYLRRAVAQSWRVSPMVVDAAPVDEVLMELRILDIEGAAQEARGKRKNG